MKTEELRLLKEGAYGFGVELSEGRLSLFSDFLDLLYSWNLGMNLTGLSEKKEIATKLFLDPLIALQYLPPTGTLLDIGTGAGIPGLPLKIARPEFLVHLLESRGKKVSFLRDVIRKLDLKETKAFSGRAEKQVKLPELLSFYDIVTARAVASLKETISICSHYLGTGSFLVTFKGPGIETEIKESNLLLKEESLEIHKKILYRLPQTEGKRYLLILKKCLKS